MDKFLKFTFGMLIAFVAPGFISLWGLSYISPAIQIWFKGGPHSQSTVTTLCILVGAIGISVPISSLRWLIIDNILHSIPKCIGGVEKHNFDPSTLKTTEDLHNFELVQENHYRYYLANSNILTSIFVTYVLRQISLRRCPLDEPLLLALVLATIVVLFVGSRDCLMKYYERTLVFSKKKGEMNMTNGARSGKKHATTKPAAKKAVAKKPAAKKAVAKKPAAKKAVVKKSAAKK